MLNTQCNIFITYGRILHLKLRFCWSMSPRSFLIKKNLGSLFYTMLLGWLQKECLWLNDGNRIALFFISQSHRILLLEGIIENFLLCFSSVFDCDLQWEMCFASWTNTHTHIIFWKKILKQHYTLIFTVLFSSIKKKKNTSSLLHDWLHYLLMSFNLLFEKLI